MNKSITKQEIIAQVDAIMAKGADLDYLGEGASQLEHALQCGYFAEKAGCDKETIVAALLHDIGRLNALEEGVNVEQLDSGLGHEYLGAKLLGKLHFNPQSLFARAQSCYRETLFGILKRNENTMVLSQC